MIRDLSWKAFEIENLCIARKCDLEQRLIKQELELEIKIICSSSREKKLGENTLNEQGMSAFRIVELIAIRGFINSNGHLQKFWYSG